MDTLTTINTRATPQAEMARPDQVKNNAGGFVFAVGEDVRVHRFLTIGVEGGTYYVGEREHTKDNASVILDVARNRGEWLVDKIVEISTAGRAPKQNPAIFALAAVAGLGDDAARKKALANLQVVCRTGSTLFLFVKYVEQFRGWGRGLREAVASWFLDKPAEALAYQMLKYRQREGWAQRDLLRLSHPKTDDPAIVSLFDFIAHGVAQPVGADDHRPMLLEGFLAAQNATKDADWVSILGEHRLSWEMLPDAALTSKAVWNQLIFNGIPATALMRQLPRLTNLDVLRGAVLDKVVEQLSNVERLRKGRVHPLNVLIAMKTYASGRSSRGSSTWTPVSKIVDALDKSFYASFAAVEPTGKRTLIALDVSGSMSSGINGDYGPGAISCREASSAMALVTLATETNADVVGFTGGSGGYGGWRSHAVIEAPKSTSVDGIAELDISSRRRLDDVVRYTAGLPFGGTDCALPMLWATAEGREYDTIVTYTDNETWAGKVHPHQALRSYREKSGINTRFIAAAFASTNYTIADPKDPFSIDVSGFDSAVPNLITDFSRGDI
jgi:60 kDa SS-A/Ro ribonucleoprotein